MFGASSELASVMEFGLKIVSHVVTFHKRWLSPNVTPMTKLTEDRLRQLKIVVIDSVYDCID